MGKLAFSPLLLLCLCGIVSAAPENPTGTQDQLSFLGSAVYHYDSNLFAQPHAQSDHILTTSVGGEYERHAGLVFLNLRAGLDYVRYDNHHDLNAWNPNFAFAAEKATGRLTGDAKVRAYKSSQAESAVNLRTTSWNYPLSMHLRYPVSERFRVVSESGYQSRRYLENDALSNYTDYTENLDLSYTYTSKLDLFTGYRLRYADTDLGHTLDHNLSFGVSGGLTAKLTGVIRLGVQNRRIHRLSEDFNQFSINTSLTWEPTRKLAFFGQLTRDFSTTATAVSVDSLGGRLRGTYALGRRYQLEGSLGAGHNIFLGRNQADRTDDYFSWEFGGSMSLRENLRCSINYTELRNQSTFVTSDYRRRSYVLAVSGHF